MRITITFATMSGPVQVETLILRVETADILDAVSRAVTHAETVTTIPIRSVYVEVT